ncbi:VanZ family protein [Actinokineospora bangkokensis]|uniref:VanZ family protein n=1 Tax=Actinokineospora bangkokensis TaxID=1193682 RepID=UPI0013015E89|nr:VanZ family protein [Actinokineospora bangkokensis]
MSVLVYVTLVVPSSSQLPVRVGLMPLVDTVRGLRSGAAENVLAATVANVALFVPLGLVWALSRAAVTGADGGWWRVGVGGLGVSALVEAAQWGLGFGAVTSDDLIANSAGAVLGWVVGMRVGRGVRGSELVP